MSDLNDLQKRALEIRAKYDQLNADAGRPAWDGKDFAMGFGGDFGDLMKLTMAKEGIRHIDDVDVKFEHELADCLWSVLVLAHYYDVDLEAAFNKTMAELDARLNGEK